MDSNQIIQTIPNFFSGKNVFITGASGFLGKVLIEKLLRSCPNIGKIYVLIRPKRNELPESRLQSMLNKEIFEKLTTEHPEAFSKLKPIGGDVSELNLGLSETDRNEIIQNANVIFHTAASVRFDDPLYAAILLNTRGTREVANLALALKNPSVFIHTSTTYCNTHQPEIGEQLYEAPFDWRKAISLAEAGDRYLLDVLSRKFLGKNHPNTYTFTKALAEQVVVDLCGGNVPTVVFRPSIVVSSYKEPLPGWVDNYNGITGIVLAVGKGFMRSIHCDSNMKPDYIPVDICIKGMIVAAWEKGTTQNKDTVSFYNGCGSGNISLSTPEMIRVGLDIVANEGMNGQLWYPYAKCSEIWMEHYLRVIFLQLLPAVFVDAILRIFKKPPMLVKIQRKMFIATTCLKYFMFNNWHFHNDNFMGLNKKLLLSDMKDFHFETNDLNLYDYCKDCMNGGRIFLLKEDIQKGNFNRQKVFILKCLNTTLMLLFYCLLFWIVFIKINIPFKIIEKNNQL